MPCHFMTSHTPYLSCECASCEETKLAFVDQGESLMQCAMSAPPTIAEWVNHHPTHFVARWRCGYPDKESHDL